MSSRRRSIAILLAVVYGLSITTSMLFHNHGIHDLTVAELCEPPIRHDHAYSCGCCGTKPHGEESPPDRAPLPCAGDDHDCSVCHFLAQKPVPTASVSAVFSAAVVHCEIRPAPIRLPAEFSPSFHSRAPPDAA